MGSAGNGGSYTFTGLDPNTTYTYTATLTGVANIDFTFTGTVTTMPSIPESTYHAMTTTFMTGIAFKAVLLCTLHYN